jgi:hypothetical protein
MQGETHRRPPWREDDETMRKETDPDQADGGGAPGEVGTADDGAEQEEAKVTAVAVAMAGGVRATAARLHQLPIRAADYSSVTAGQGAHLFLRQGGSLSRVDLADPGCARCLSLSRSLAHSAEPPSAARRRALPSTHARARAHVAYCVGLLWCLGRHHSAAMGA